MQRSLHKMKFPLAIGLAALLLLLMLTMDSGAVFIRRHEYNGTDLRFAAVDAEVVEVTTAPVTSPEPETVSENSPTEESEQETPKITTVTLKLTGTVSSGYLKLKYKGTVYESSAMNPGETVTLTLNGELTAENFSIVTEEDFEAEVGAEIRILPCWGSPNAPQATPDSEGQTPAVTPLNLNDFVTAYNTAHPLPQEQGEEQGEEEIGSHKEEEEESPTEEQEEQQREEGSV